MLNGGMQLNLMNTFENLSDDLFKPIPEEELQMTKGGTATTNSFTISAKNSDPTYRDTSSMDPDPAT